MIRKIVLLALGITELLRPRPLVDFWVNLAVRGDQDVELRPWVYTAARIEGVLIVLWMLTRGRKGATEAAGKAS